MKQCIYAPAGLTLCLAAGVAAGSDGFDWVTIGDPGNRGVRADELPLEPNPQDLDGLGAVGYEYRLARTEVTVAQHFEFVSSFADRVDEWSRFTASEVLGYGILRDNRGNLSIRPGYADSPTTMSWHTAARFVNWLHNGRSSDPLAPERGVYDASTFYAVDANGNSIEQRTKAADAQYWIPTASEWAKGMHWDPAKNNGEGGYWLYPHSSDELPIVGAPGEPGAQTSAGYLPTDADGNEPYPWSALPVGSYSDTRSPWGLLDGSGGVREWTETSLLDAFSGILPRTTRGSDRQSDTVDIFLFDRLDLSGWGDFSLPYYQMAGIRVAAAVPAVPTLAPVAGFVLVMCRVRRRPGVCLAERLFVPPTRGAGRCVPPRTSRARSVARGVAISGASDESCGTGCPCGPTRGTLGGATLASA